jgi:hypothetical protein
MQSYYLIYIEEGCSLYTLNDEEVESVQSIDDFYNWLKDKEAKIIFISNKQIKNELLTISEEIEENQELVEKKNELQTYYPDYSIGVFSSIKKRNEELKEEKIVEKETVVKKEEKKIDVASKRIFIRCFNSYISVKEEEIDGSFVSLKKFGEESFKFEDDFWQWFKKKIDYDNELLSFDVISDIEDFTIDSEINVAEFNLSKEEIIEKKQLSTNKKHPKTPPKRESLSEYYANKTKLYQGL